MTIRFGELKGGARITLVVVLRAANQTGISFLSLYFHSAILPPYHPPTRQSQSRHIIVFYYCTGLLGQGPPPPPSFHFTSPNCQLPKCQMCPNVAAKVYPGGVEGRYLEDSTTYQVRSVATVISVLELEMDQYWYL